MLPERIRRLAYISAAACAVVHLSNAQPIPVEDIARLPAMSSVSVSTDGKTMVALIGPASGNDRDRAVVAAWDLADLSKAPVIVAPDGKESEFIDVQALKDGKVQVAVRQPFTGRLSGCAEGNEIGTTRTWTVKLLLTDTTFQKFEEPFIDLGSTRGRSQSTEDCIRITARGAVFDRLPLDPRNVLISRIGSDFNSEIGLLDLQTKDFKTLFKNSGALAVGYIDPADGEVMSASGTDEKRSAFEGFTQIKATKGGPLESHDALTIDLTRLQELTVAHRDRESGRYYILTNKFSDKVQVFVYDPVTKSFGAEPVFAHLGFDASGIITSSQANDFGKMLGFAYNADVTRYEWLDAEYGGIVLGLERQLKAETVSIIYRNSDFSLIVFSASGSTMCQRRSKIRPMGGAKPGHLCRAHGTRREGVARVGVSWAHDDF